jgi:hypothetical protein
MGGLSAFSKVVPYLTNPLVVIGLALFLFFSVHRVLLKSGILRPLRRADAPAIVRLVLHYGFAVALIVIVLGFSYAIVQYYVSEVLHKHVDLSVVDFVPEPDNTYDVKLKNSGTDTAFVSEVRIVFFRAVAGNTSCMPVPFEYYEYPFDVRAGQSTVRAQNGNVVGSDIAIPKPEETAEEKELKESRELTRALMGALYNEEMKKFADPYWITQPLKVSQKVPPGDVDRFKIHFQKNNIIKMFLPECQWSVSFKAFALIIYDRGKVVTSPYIYLHYKEGT